MSWKNSSLSGASKLNNHYPMSKRDTLCSGSGRCQDEPSPGGWHSAGPQGPEGHHAKAGSPGCSLNCKDAPSSLKCVLTVYSLKPASIKSRRTNSKILPVHLSGVGLAWRRSKTVSFSICFFFFFFGDIIKFWSKDSYNFPLRNCGAQGGS